MPSDSYRDELRISHIKNRLKIIHITAAYKPAYIYGGPTMSVAKLCEALGGSESGSCGGVELEEINGLSVSSLGLREAGDGPFGSLPTGQAGAQVQSLTVEVFTTTANGKTELVVPTGEPQLVDGVRVTYFKRLTKDHTHFSPKLLISLRREILRNKKNPPPPLPNSRDKHSKGGQTLAIHIHAWWNLVSILSCWVAKWYHVPVILSPRGMLTEYTLGNRNVGFKSIIHWFIGKRLLKYCHIHATSEKEKEDILKFIKPRSVTVIANLVELESSSEYRVASSKYQEASSKYQAASSKYQEASVKYNLESQESSQPSEGDGLSIKLPLETIKHPVLPSLQGEGLGVRSKNESSTQQLPDLTAPPTFKLIFLSRIEEKKGLELLFEALAKFNVDWSLTIAGSGDEKYVERLLVSVESLGVSTKINWVGQVKNEDKFELLADHDLMVLTSYNENFANVVIESLSVGTPVLLSTEVGLADYIVAKDLGWITTLETESIGEALNKAYLAVDFREKVRVQAPQLIKEDFNDDTLSKKYIGLYEDVYLNGNGALRTPSRWLSGQAEDDEFL